MGFLEKDDLHVPVEDRLSFEVNGHIVTRGVFLKEQLELLRPIVSEGIPLPARYVRRGVVVTVILWL